MSLGMILLVVLALLILFGVLQRVLDRMALTDRQALLLVALIFCRRLAAGYPFGNGFRQHRRRACAFRRLRLSVFHAGTGKERIRCLVASVLTAAVIDVISLLFPADPVAMPFDPMVLYGLCGGVIAWLTGRSRRSAFIAGVLGMILADTAISVVNWTRGVQQVLYLGGAGALDAVVLSGVTAVMLCELFGEIMERMARGKTDGSTLQGGQKRMKEKLSRLALSFALAIALYAAFLPSASADDVAESLHVAVDGTGAYLFSISGEISEGDEYISADNILYRIATVQNGNAIAEKIGGRPCRTFRGWTWDRLSPSSHRKAPCPPPAQKPMIPAS